MLLNLHGNRMRLASGGWYESDVVGHQLPSSLWLIAATNGSYGAVSPMEGQLDWMICRKMNAEMMAESLHQVGLCIVGITFLATVSCRNLFEEIFCQAE